MRVMKKTEAVAAAGTSMEKKRNGEAREIDGVAVTAAMAPSVGKKKQREAKAVAVRRNWRMQQQRVDEAGILKQRHCLAQPC